MTRFLLALALYASAAGMAEAQVARWLGEFQYTGGTCPTGQGRSGVAFQPSLDGANGPDSWLSIFSHYNATNLRLRDADFGKSFKKVKVFGMDAMAEPFGEHPVSIRFSKVRPSNIEADTPMIEITGQIKDPPFDQGCVRDFTIVLVNESL
jgi:hypothetical protein